MMMLNGIKLALGFSFFGQSLRFLRRILCASFPLCCKSKLHFARHANKAAYHMLVHANFTWISNFKKFSPPLLLYTENHKRYYYNASLCIQTFLSSSHYFSQSHCPQCVQTVLLNNTPFRYKIQEYNLP